MSDLRTQLTGIYKRNGELTPQIVVDEARPVDAPLHSHFEWDDGIAGEKYRLTQAASLIRVVRTEFTSEKSGEKKFIRAFSSLHESGENDSVGKYMPTEEILEDPTRKAILLRNMQRDISALKNRYGHLVEFAAMMRDAIGEDDAE
jgi:hypothetical protein